MMAPPFSHTDAPDNHFQCFFFNMVVFTVSDAVWGCLGVAEGEFWCIWVVF